MNNPEGYVLVQVKQLAQWREWANNVAAWSTKADRSSEVARLKASISSAMISATQPTASNAGERELSLGKIAREAFDDYWHEDSKGIETDAWEQCAQAVAAAVRSRIIPPCESCFGTGVDGDVGPDGQTIDIKCGNCDGTGRAALASKPPAGEQKPVGWIEPTALEGLVAGEWKQVGVTGDRVGNFTLAIYRQPLPEPVAPPAREGWKEAAIAWTVCASIHEQWAKGKDALYKTRHADFERHAEEARSKALSATPPAQAVQITSALTLALDEYGVKDERTRKTLIDLTLHHLRAARTRGNGVEP